MGAFFSKKKSWADALVGAGIPRFILVADAG